METAEALDVWIALFFVITGVFALFLGMRVLTNATVPERPDTHMRFIAAVLASTALAVIIPELSVALYVVFESYYPAGTFLDAPLRSGQPLAPFFDTELLLGTLIGQAIAVLGLATAIVAWIWPKAITLTLRGLLFIFTPLIFLAIGAIIVIIAIGEPFSLYSRTLAWLSLALFLLFVVSMAIIGWRIKAMEKGAGEETDGEPGPGGGTAPPPEALQMLCPAPPFFLINQADLLPQRPKQETKAKAHYRMLPHPPHHRHAYYPWGHGGPAPMPRPEMDCWPGYRRPYDPCHPPEPCPPAPCDDTCSSPDGKHDCCQWSRPCFGCNPREDVQLRERCECLERFGWHHASIQEPDRPKAEPLVWLKTKPKSLPVPGGTASGGTGGDGSKKKLQNHAWSLTWIIVCLALIFLVSPAILTPLAFFGLLFDLAWSQVALVLIAFGCLLPEIFFILYLKCSRSIPFQLPSVMLSTVLSSAVVNLLFILPIAALLAPEQAARDGFRRQEVEGLILSAPRDMEIQRWLRDLIGIEPSIYSIAMLLVIFMSIMVMIFVSTRKRLTVGEGFALFFIFLAFVLFVLTGWQPVERFG